MQHYDLEVRNLLVRKMTFNGIREIEDSYLRFMTDKKTRPIIITWIVHTSFDILFFYLSLWVWFAICTTRYPGQRQSLFRLQCVWNIDDPWAYPSRKGKQTAHPNVHREMTAPWLACVTECKLSGLARRTHGKRTYARVSPTHIRTHTSKHTHTHI